jgi:peroxiredoxin
MPAPFTCKECGAPRQYINQYCPNCESIGPHIPASDSHKSKINRTGTAAAKNRPPRINTFEDEFQYSKPRKEKVHAVKEPKPEQIRPPRAEKRAEYREDREDTGEKKPFSFPFPKQSVLYVTFFVVLGVLVILLIANNSSSGPNPIPDSTKVVSTNPNNNTSTVAGNNTASSNTSTSSSPSTPVSIPADNGTKPSTTTVPSTPKDTAVPKLAGAKPEANITDTTVTLTWKTDEKSKATVKYGTTKACDYFSPDDPGFKTEHNVYISNLAADTLYYYQIIATDEANNSGTLVENSFRTEIRSDAAPYVGSKAPDFTLRTIDGKEASLSQYRGKKVILNFWASWCSPCKVELPHLQEIWDKYKNGNEVTVLTVAGSESIENDITSYMSSKGYTFTVCLDVTESTFNRYDILSIPKTFFIDKNGIIKKVQQGMFTSPGEIDFMLSSY